MKRQYFFVGIILSFFTSCSYFDLSYTNVKIYTSQPTTIIHNEDTLRTIRDKVRLRVKRKKEPLKFLSINDDTSANYEIKAKIDPSYYYGLILTRGLSHVIQKKFFNDYGSLNYTYPHHIFINPENQISKRDHFNRRAIYFHLSIPLVNSFYLQPIDEDVKHDIGLFGLQLGFDFFYAKSHFLNIGYMVVGSGSRRKTEFESFIAHSFQFSKNHKIKSFSIGYGFTTEVHTWTSRFYDNRTQRLVIIDTFYTAWGFILPIYYQIGKSFQMGVIYKPTFYAGGNARETGVYEHIISLDVAWKIRLR